MLCGKKVRSYTVFSYDICNGGTISLLHSQVKRQSSKFHTTDTVLENKSQK
jgi:hypothetical protein